MPDLLYALLGVNIVLYLVLIIGFLELRKQHSSQVTNLKEAFELLEKRLKRAFPDLRDGFTWNEAMSKARPVTGKNNWFEIDHVLKKYQEFRYGGDDPGDVRVDSIVRLAMTLPRGAKK